MKENNENSMNSIERVSTILSLKEPDYVPIWLLIDFLPAKYYDISVEELIFDPIKSQKAYEWIYEKLGGYDITLPGSAMYAVHINPFPIIYSSYYLDWRLPGRDLPKNTSPQLSEKSSKDPLINEKDYEKLIEKGFLQVFNFKRAGLRDLMKLNKMVELIKKNSEKWWNYFKVPTLADAAAYLPFEFLSYLRGSTNFMKDLYRYPEKIKEVCDFMIDGVIAIGEYAASLIDGRTILTALIRSSCDFISDKYFEEFVFPYLKKAVSKWLSDGYIVQLHCDTDWTSRLHYF
ncbi:MAG: uroporphyrinogen decarboxylase family protein, partial [Promethearchaeota archaeon]